jgi:hypothetical protein
MKKYHEVKDLSFTETTMKITIDGKKHEFDLNKLSPRLKSSTHSDRHNYEISPSGYGIHWPTIDEDLSIDGLLKIIHRPPRRRKSLTYK